MKILKCPRISNYGDFGESPRIQAVGKTTVSCLRAAAASTAAFYFAKSRYDCDLTAH